MKQKAFPRMLRLGRAAVTLLASLLATVMVVSFALTMAIRTPAEALRDFERLRVSGELTSRIAAQERFRRLYADRFPHNPDAAELRSHFDAQLAEKGWFTLDSVMTEYLVTRFGGVDGRAIPPGVYVGLRAIGPDEPPLVRITQYPYHFGLFVRHGYVLIVHPGRQPARVYSAGLEGDFAPSTSQPKQLYARSQPYISGAYDFPRQGQAIHELVAITRDPDEIGSIEARLRELQSKIRKADRSYLLIRRNSNTVVGCLLTASGASIERVADSSAEQLVRLRLAGIGFPLGVIDQDRRPDPCARSSG